MLVEIQMFIFMYLLFFYHDCIFINFYSNAVHKFPVYGTIKLYCIVLYCIVLYCIVLYCIVLRCVALRCVALRCVALRCVALRCVALRCVALRCVALRCVALRCVALHCIVEEENNFLFKVEQNGKYNTSEFAITSTSHTICTT